MFQNKSRVLQLFACVLLVFIADPYGMQVIPMERRNGNVFAYQFVPEYVGPYIINLEYGKEVVPGSPFVCNVYDAKQVKVVDATASGNIGQEASFTG